MLERVNQINNAYMNLVAPKIQVFKMDKIKTVIDDLYKEEKYARIYLPPFDIRAFHLDMRWAQLLGPEPFKEQEENIQLTMNFENMVQVIRDLKNAHTSDIYISYGDTGVPSALKTDTQFQLKIDDSTIATYDLQNIAYDTISKLASAVAGQDNFSVTTDGINDSSVDLVNFAQTSFQDAQLGVYSKDNIYNNITDVIEYGDLVLTNKWRLYEVLNANPSGDFGWDWIQYTITCNFIRMDQVNLPGDYETQIAEHQYGIKDRVDME